MTSSASGSLRKAMNWAGTGMWAVADQGLFAVANFILNVALARWLGQGEYGAFATIYALFLLLATAHTALVVEPMLVFARGRFEGTRQSYLPWILRFHWWIAAGCGAGLGFVGVLLLGQSSGISVYALLASGVATPALLYQWLSRRACYLDFQPHRAAIGGLVYFVAMTAGVLVLHALHLLSAAAAFLVLGGASLLSAHFLWTRYLSAHRPSAREAPREPVIVDDSPLIVHWRYGRWSVLASALVWLTGDVFYVVLPLMHDLEASATLRAAANLVMPAVQGFSALAIVAIPALVRARSEGSFQRTLMLALSAFIALGSLYGLFLYLWGEPLIEVLYGSGYSGVIAPLTAFAFVPGAYAAALLLSSALRSLERPKDVFKANAVPALFVVSIGMLMASRWGPVGAAVGMAISAWLTAAAAGVLVYRRLADTDSRVGGDASGLQDAARG